MPTRAVGSHAAPAVASAIRNLIVGMAISFAFLQRHALEEYISAVYWKTESDQSQTENHEDAANTLYQSNPTGIF
jgi:hypothetical protein